MKQVQDMSVEELKKELDDNKYLLTILTGSVYRNITLNRIQKIIGELVSRGVTYDK